MIGQTISHYTILEKLGQGGMGVVYKARDTQLDRDVALKFLPHDLVVTNEERARFIREAKAASALDHPNICTIHEVDQTPDGVLFIVMGYYEGTPLSRRIARGPLEITEAVGIAIQIVEGLKAAHDKGIVHRDIKSSNIILTGDGQVKILDFGLAQKRGLSKLTRTGTTVGTASYMSPEQAKGEAVDHRSDLWSLGVVLYEMVTGRVPFPGEHEAAILYLVVNEDPQPVESSLPDAPPELIHILRSALEKEPGERYKSAEDFLTDLRRLKRDTSRTGHTPITRTKKQGVTRKTAFFAAAGSLLLICAALYFYLATREVEINVNFMQRTIDVPFQKYIRATISPSGKWIVFSAADKFDNIDLYVVGSSGGVPRRITTDSSSLPRRRFQHNDALSDPHVAPDENEIIYSRFRSDGVPELCRVPLVGGQVTKVAEGLFGRWSRDGKLIGYIKYPRFSESKFAEFWTVRPDGNDNRRVFIDTAGLTEDFTGALLTYYFDWSPDGNSIAWLRRTRGMWCEIVRRDLSDGRETPTTTDSTIKTSLCWLSNGKIIYRASGEDGVHLWMIPEEGGIPVQITRGTVADEFPSASLDGSRLLFNGMRKTWDLWVGVLDGSNPEKIATIEGDVHDHPDYLPSTRQIVFPKSYANSTSYNLAVIDRDGSNERWITTGNTFHYMPKWSPDGKWISVGFRKPSEPFDSMKLILVNPSTMEPSRPLLGPQVWFGEWANDTVVRAFQFTALGNRDVKSIEMRLDGSAPSQIATDSVAVTFIGDGKYAYYVDVRARAGSNQEWIVPIERWDRNGGTDPQPFHDQIPDGWVSTRARGRSRFNLALDPATGDLWKVWFPDQRKERVLAACEPLKGCTHIGMSWDENEYVFFSKLQSTSSIVLIENLFK